jgi:O-antigen/teichoic acid export membrane protein
MGGQIGPLVAAAVAIPILVRHMGAVRFGLLTIAWMIVGYFNLFDLGIGRALTRLVSDKIGRGREDVLSVLVDSGLKAMFILGCFAAALLAGSARFLVSVLHVPSEFRAETLSTLYWLALSIPAVILTAGLRAVLEGYQRFDLANAIRTPMGIWIFVGPLCVLPISHRLDHVVLTIIVGRYVAAGFYWKMVRRQVGQPLGRSTLDRGILRELLSFGGWLTVSNIVSPIMVYMDRFFIGALIGTSIVAFYTTPYEVVFKLNILSEGLFGVLFPFMTRRFASEGMLSSRVVQTSANVIGACMFPIVMVIVVVADAFLRAWVGPEFAEKGATVMRLLAIGMLVNGFAKVPFNALQAHGRADVTAKIHLFELPVYVTGLVLLTRAFGIRGTALAWALRMLLDASLLYWKCASVVGVPKRLIVRIATCAAAACALLGIVALVPAMSWRVVIGSSILVVAALISWSWILSEEERTQIGRLILRRRVGVSQ